MTKLITFAFILFSTIETFGQTIIKTEENSSFPWKEFTINNNKWGAYKIKKGTYDQTIFLENGVAGWKWTTPGKSYGVLGYPMIFLGVTAWNKLNEIDRDNYFKNIGEINQFNVSYDMAINVNDEKYNLSFDFWLHNSPKVAFETIATEVMIWEDYNKFKPFGKKKGKITTKSGQYEVYVGKIFKKELNKGWDYIAFVRLNKRKKGELNILEFTKYIQDNNLSPKAPYLSSFEFGTEILTSTGELKINKYEVNIQ